MKHSGHPLAAALVVCLIGGCTAIVSAPTPPGDIYVGTDPNATTPGRTGAGGTSGVAPAGGGAPGAGNTPGAGAATGSAGTGGPVVVSPVVPPDPLSSPTPVVDYALLRLTNTQYRNTVHDLFPTLNPGTLALPNENVVDRFRNAASGQTATSLLIENYQTAAESVAAAAAANFAGVLPCAATTTAAEDTCVQGFIASLGKRAYRRPLTTEERTRAFAFYKAARAVDTFPVAVTSLVQVFLQSPAFLYRLEAGRGVATTALVPLSSYEMASRLSYFLFDTMPDAALLAAADLDQLATPAQVEAQARRMLADPRARPVVANFHYQWLGLVRTENMVKDAKAFPTFNQTVGQALHDSAVRFMDHVFWEENSLRALLTDSHAFVNDALAASFGVAAPGSSALQMVTANASQRSGILTHPGVLAGLAGPVDDSPVRRGLLVLQSFMCRTLQPPPPGVNTNPPVFDPAAPSTTRQRLETRHAVGSCNGCHTAMDDIGFAFENYDAVGMWRTTENGLPVNAASQLAGTDVDGPFTGGVELSQKLAQSQQVADCVSYQWLRYALGLNMGQINVAAARSIAGAFSTAQGSFKELLVAVAKSDTFRSLKVSN